MTQLASDDFERANGALGSSWTANSAESGGLTIVSGAVVKSGADDASSIWNGVAWPVDQYSEIIFSAVDNGLGTGYGVVCRSSSIAKTYYRLVSGTVGYELGKVVAGSFTVLASNATPAVAIGDVLRLEVTGTGTVTLRMYKNGVQFGGDVTDSSSPINSGNLGVAYSSVNNGGIASWAGGDFSGGGASGRNLMLMGCGV